MVQEVEHHRLLIIVHRRLFCRGDAIAQGDQRFDDLQFGFLQGSHAAQFEYQRGRIAASKINLMAHGGHLDPGGDLMLKLIKDHHIAISQLFGWPNSRPLRFRRGSLWRICVPGDRSLLRHALVAVLRRRHWLIRRKERLWCLWAKGLLEMRRPFGLLLCRNLVGQRGKQRVNLFIGFGRRQRRRR